MPLGAAFVCYAGPLEMPVNFARACNEYDRVDACHLFEAFVPVGSFPGKSERLSIISPPANSQAVHIPTRGICYGWHYD